MTTHALARDDKDVTAFDVNGALVVPDPSGALYWPDEGMLVVSDLHLEKGSSYARRGLVLPPYDTRSTLRVLGELCVQWQPDCVIALGDSFHDDEAHTRLGNDDLGVLKSLVAAHDWTWILGNHDEALPEDFGGTIAEEIQIGRLTFRHEMLPLPLPGQVTGHYHPCAKVRREGRSVRRRCFVTDGVNLIMPAMGAYTGGLNVLDQAYRPHFDNGFVAWMLGRDRVYPVGSSRLSPDR